MRTLAGEYTGGYSAEEVELPQPARTDRIPKSSHTKKRRTGKNFDIFAVLLLYHAFFLNSIADSTKKRQEQGQNAGENVDISGKKPYTIHTKANLLKDRDAKPRV